MFACPRDNGANALQMRFREGTQSLGPDANHAFTDGALYRQCACQCKGASDGERLPAGESRNFLLAPGPVMPLRLPILILQHLPMGGDQSSHSVKRKPYANPSLAEARTLGRGPRRDRSGHSRFLATRVANGNQCRSTRPGSGGNRCRRSTCAILRCEGPGKHRTGGACQVPSRAVLLLAERPGDPGWLGDFRGRKDSRQRAGACLLSEAL